MGLSETILAAMIGAIATVSTALFQLFHVLRSNKSDARPKRGNSLRSFFAVLMLMVASAGGGFLYSELLKQRAAQDIQAMRDELNGRLQVLAASTEKLASMRAVDASRPEHNLLSSSVAATLPVPEAQAENASIAMMDSSLYAPACVIAAGCNEAARQSMQICGAIPRNAQVKKAELFLRDATAPASAETQVALDQEFAGAKFSGTFSEQPSDQGSNRKTICVNLLHWSEQPHIARLVLYYGAVDSDAERVVPKASMTTATQSMLPSTHAVSLTTASAAP